MLDDILQRITAGPTLAYAILILALILAPKIAEALRLPAMVGLVLAGMALGPHGTGALASKEIALSSIGEFGLLYLMFSAGLELDLELFMKMRFLVALAAHEETTFHRREERVAGPVVTGRSLKPHPA